MKCIITTLFALLIPISATQAAIKFTNQSTTAFKPDFKFITHTEEKYHCHQGLPLVNPGDTVTLPEDCFSWGEDNGYLLLVIGVQPNEPDQVAYCPEMSPPLSVNDNLEITFLGVDADKPQPANGICQVTRLNSLR